LDVAIACRGANTVEIFLGHGNGSFQAKVDYPTGKNPVGVKFGDFNGDGYLDLAVANNGGSSVSVLLNVGQAAPGTFAAKADYTSGLGPYGLAVADFNGDGILDIAVVNNTDETVAVLLGNGLAHGDGTFQGATPYAVGSSPVALTAADISGDGLPDILVANSGDGTITYLQATLLGPLDIKSPINVNATAMNGIVAGDFHGLGRLDIAVGDGDNTFSILKSNGNGTFGAPATFTSSNQGAAFTALAPTDFNGDGIIDLLLIDSATGTFEAWAGQ
jgi:hypothetical protein